jgi:hypothetical protein
MHPCPSAGRGARSAQHATAGACAGGDATKATILVFQKIEIGKAMHEHTRANEKRKAEQQLEPLLREGLQGGETAFTREG